MKFINNGELSITKAVTRALIPCHYGIYAAWALLGGNTRDRRSTSTQSLLDSSFTRSR